jgi:mono/diheme cytochrome c family protein
MRTFLAVVLVLSLPFVSTAPNADQGGASGGQSSLSPAGDAQRGKAVWALGNTSCRNCHGGDGEGAYGPVLAGRKLPYERFRTYVRTPAGRMPAYVESQLTDQEIADLVAYFDSLPAVATPGPWRFALPEGAPRGQQLAVSTIGCGQCHGVTLETPRHGAAEVSGDWEWFKQMVYDHTTMQPQQWSQLDRSIPASTPAPGRVRMGNYSRTRLPEATLMEIWTWMTDLGHLVPLVGRITPGTTDAQGITYTVTVANAGVKEKGLVAEDVKVALIIPPEAQVVSATGPGYQGVRRDEEAKGAATLSVTVALWQVPRMAASDRHTFTITLAGAIKAAEPPRGTIRWAKPAVKADEVVDILPTQGRGRG